MSAQAQSTLPLYQQLALLFEGAIKKGALRTGDRLPSVRAVAQQHQVSVATAVQVYRHLENARLVDARAKSGYFVSGHWAHSQLREQPMNDGAAGGAPIAKPSFVGMHDRVIEFIGIARDSCSVRLDVATGPSELYPMEKLAKLSAQLLRQNPALITQYSTGTGYPHLKERVAQRLAEVGCTLTVDELVVTNGVTEALHLALRATTVPGNTVAVETPTYFGILQLCESMGLKVLELPTHPRTGLSLEALAHASEKPGSVHAVICIPNFSNPLGALMPDSHKAALVKLLAARSIALIEDDVYGELYQGTRRPPPAKSWDAEGGVILCSSASKTLAPGLRTGWVSGGRWHKAIERLKFTQSICTAEAGQAVIAEFMANGGYDHHMRKMRAAFAQQTQQMAAAVLRYFPEEACFTLPQGGYLLWVELPKHIDSRVVFEAARAQSIGIAPGIMFSASGRYDHCVRLNCGYPWSEPLERAMATLGNIIKRQMIKRV